MKRTALFIALVLSFSMLPTPTSAAPTRDEVPPILLNGQNGSILLYVYLGVATENTSVPMMGIVSVKMCDGNDCEIYSGNYMSDNEGYSLHRYIYTEINIGVRFGKHAVTAQVPNDLIDGSNGWSVQSNAVTGWTDTQAWFKSRSNRPVLEVQYKAIESSKITRADLCANYNETHSITTNDSSFASFDLAGYTSLQYVLTENGAQIKTEDLSPSVPLMGSIPACGNGTLGTAIMKNIDGLSAGKSYKLTYTVSGPGKPEVNAILDFVAPGACPSGEIILAPSPRTFYYGVIGTEGFLKSYLATGTYPWRLESILGERLAPIYFSASKVGPYKGQLLNVRTSTEKWRYVKEVDDWALAVENAVPITGAAVLSYTVFADCAMSTMKPTLSLDTSLVNAADQACVIEANEVIPTRAGQCRVIAELPVSNASSKSVGKRASVTKVAMNYIFTSVATLTRGSTTSPACTLKLTRSKKTASNASLLKCAGLTKVKGQTVSLAVSASSKKVCIAKTTGLIRIKKGTCKVTVRLKVKSKVVSSKVISVAVQ